ncbi:MAG: hypothetical protein GC185_08400 [Alphaproteobacteria bacterium]|nr:hypothetical protein [Alphaproteobacteria bacterium]
MMVHSSYTALLEQVKSGQLRVISLLAPARSSSTALERALLESPSVDLQVNDPWALYDEAAREPKTYDYILDRVMTSDGTGNKTVLIKNVADYIPPGECWERWCALADAHVFLIRNPLLTLQSLFRMLVRHYSGDQVVVEPVTLDEYARRHGFGDWAALKADLSSGTDFTAHEELFRAFFTRDQQIHREPVMYVPVLQAAGEGASPEEVFAYRISGWEALGEHFRHSCSIVPAGKMTVMDSTLFRAEPQKAMRFLTLRLGLVYAEGMSAWQEGAGKEGTGKGFTTDYDGAVPYYDRVLNAHKIEPPTEVPPPVEAFPPFFRRHLEGKGGAFDIYREMLAELDRHFIREFELTEELKRTDPFFAENVTRLKGL